MGEAEETAILVTADYITKDKTDTEKAKAIIEAKKYAKDKGKMGKRGKSKKAEVEKYPRLEPKEFETKAKDKAEAGEIVRPKDEKVETEKIDITKTEKDTLLEAEKTGLEVEERAKVEPELLEIESGKLAKGKGKKGKKGKDKQTKASEAEPRLKNEAEVKAVISADKDSDLKTVEADPETSVEEFKERDTVESEKTTKGKGKKGE